MNARPFYLAACLLWLAAAPTVSRADIFADDFDDNTLGNAYTRIIDDASALDIHESSGTAAVTSTGGGSFHNDALYLSNGADGFRLSTADAFHVQIDYTFTTVGGSAPAGEGLGLVLGLGEDLEGQNSAAVGFGYANPGIGAFGVGTVVSRVDDAQTIHTTDPTAADNGSLSLDYQPMTDTLTLGYTTSIGAGQTPLVGLVQGTWNASDVLLSFGARGGGYTASPATTFLDNLRVTHGTLVALPEPTSMALLGMGSLGLLLRRRWSGSE